MIGSSGPVRLHWRLCVPVWYVVVGLGRAYVREIVYPSASTEDPSLEGPSPELGTALVLVAHQVFGETSRPHVYVGSPVAPGSLVVNQRLQPIPGQPGWYACLVET